MPRNFSSLIDQAVACNITPCVSFSNGSHDYHGGCATNNTVYDLASLTKILGTSLAVARAIISGHMSLSEVPFAVWPQVSLKDLLAHTSGLAAHLKFYECAGISRTNFSSNKLIIFDNLFKQRPDTGPRRVRLYSDLNFLALGWLLEQRLKKPLIQIFKDTWDSFEIHQDLKFFNAISPSPTNINIIAPTGVCPVRKRRIRAHVHDLNCYFLGGLAGHAGLFGDLNSLKAFGVFFLRCIKKPKSANEELIAYFARHGLGFDKPHAAGSVAALSPQSFGHFGFSGTSLWVDPGVRSDQGRYFALLTNRVDANLRPEGIFWLRKNIHKAGIFAKK